MNEMIERVARRLHAHEKGYDIWDLPMDPGYREWWLEHARVALEAMRGPTEEIELELYSIAQDHPRGVDVRDCWSGLIDAALSIRDEKDGRPPAAPGRAGDPAALSPSGSSHDVRSSLTQTGGEE